MGLLDGKRAVITGSGRGLGRAYAHAFTAEGASVLVNDVDYGEAERVVGEITAKGGTAVATGDSVYPYDSAGRIINACIDNFGGIDIVVNNAGILRDRTVWNMSVEEMDDVLDVHVKGTFYCTQHAVRVFREQGHGVVLNVTSGAHHGNFGQTNYAGAKGMIASMTYTWGLELPGRGIRVNAISPAAATRMSATVPGAEPPPPETAAPLAVFLCSDEADWVHGQVFNSSGETYRLMEQPKYGLSMSMPGGWTVRAVCDHFRRIFHGRLEPYGLGKPPYRWYDGVPKWEPDA